jgi:hypothetical protein
VIRIYPAAKSQDTVKSHSRHARKPQHDDKRTYKLYIQVPSSNDLYSLEYPNSLTAFYSTRALLCQRTRYYWPIWTKFGLSRENFIKIPSIKFHGNTFSGSGVDTCGRTDTTTLTDAFRDYANAPKSLQAGFSSRVLSKTTIILTLIALLVDSSWLRMNGLAINAF